jgi:hypothetical protein
MFRSREGLFMKRDMDLIRELLLKLEALPLAMGDVWTIPSDAPALAVPGYGVHQIDYHLSLIWEAGFIDDANASPMFGIGFRSLTWEGHDFLDSVRDPKIWEKTKKGVEGAGGFTVDLLKDLAKGLVKKQIEEYTGVKL